MIKCLNHISAIFDINLSFWNWFLFHYQVKTPLKILDDKYLTVTSFPLQHRIPSYGFSSGKKIRKKFNKRKDLINIKFLRSDCPQSKKGEDFITPDGSIIKNEDITLPPVNRCPMHIAAIQNISDVWLLLLWEWVFCTMKLPFDKGKEDLAAITGHSTTLDAAKTALMLAWVLLL